MPRETTHKTKLLESYVKSLKPDESRTVHWDTEMKGFGVLPGPRGNKFILTRRVDGKLLKATIGTHGAKLDDGRKLTVVIARKLAEARLAELKGARAKSGATLRDGMNLHIAKMRTTGGKGGKAKHDNPCSERSIKDFKACIERNLAEWLDRPFSELTRSELRKVHDGVLANAKPREGATNKPGAGMAKRIVGAVSAIYGTMDDEGDEELGFRNPRFKTRGLAPRETRIDHDDFPEWLATVKAINPVRRDLQLLCLSTGLRSESARHMRWEDIDWDKGLLHVAKAKGNRPYTVPLTKKVARMLKARRRDNAKLALFDGYTGDQGHVFPTRTRSAPFSVIPVSEAKEYHYDKKTKERVKVLPGLHTLRKTYNSVALEIGIGADDRQALMNHEGQGVNVKHYGFPQNWDRLGDAQRKIEAALWERLTPNEK